MLESGDSLGYTQDVLLIDELFQRVLNMMRAKKAPSKDNSEGEEG